MRSVSRTAKPLKRRLPGIAPLLAVLFFCPPVPAAGAENIRRVVVLYPTADGQPGSILFDQGLRSTFVTSSAEPVELYSEYLDSARFPEEQHQRLLAHYLRQKYAERKIDVVIPALAPSLDFALKYREEMFSGVPIVFGAIDQREVEARELGPGVVGVPMRMDLVPTLELALRLHPNARRVVVITGTAKTDTFWEAEARQSFRGYEGKLELVYLAGLPMDDLLKEVTTLPDESIILYLHVMRDGSGNAFTPAEVAERIAAVANAPVYGHIDSYLGRGIVGGSLLSFEAEGKNAALTASRILAGEKPESMPAPGAGENAYMFDWRQLRRWGISEESLPPGSVVRFRQPSFWDVYRWYIIGGVALCVIEALLILGLLLQRVYRRRAEQRFRQVVEAAPSGMIMVGPDGRIVLANAQTEALFGYRKEELLGRPVEMLVPERFRDKHAAQRARFFAAPASRAMGEGRDLFGRRKDGSEFPVEVWLNPVRAGVGFPVLASIIDITERRRAEESLRESQRELRALTGRLLQAQETERRRIARELHDDLNQSLSLLAVELDLLGQAPPGAEAAELCGRLDELSARVKQLSSAVHDLSHNLHPSKLEQLGLVAGVRGLCKEQVQAHGLEVEFNHRRMPPSIPDDTVLCLYRIAQEALRNVIKHSGARHVRVELSGSEDGVTLRVADDGVGFDLDAVDGHEGLGLVSMRERLYLVGGTMVIDSRPSAGTRIDVRVPLSTTGQGPSAQPGKVLQAQPSRI
jgi:PAS domain S-box-containing protein